MRGTTVIFGFGTIGRLVGEALLERGDAVRVAQRTRPAALPEAVAFTRCDILEPDAVRRAVEGADQVLLAVGFPYDARVWRTAWPKTMSNVVEACAAIGARIVFIDNLYQLGPQDRPRREDMPLSLAGEKPAILTGVTHIWTTASDRVRVAALRCPDFYGPEVSASHLGQSGFGRIGRNQAALLLAPPDMPHDFAYAADIARAAITLLDAPDDAFGQVWNMPCAPTRTPREILQLGADAIGVKLKVIAVPLRLLRPLGIVSRLMREVADVGFTWDRPYVVDAGKFTRRFWSDVTPFEVGAAAAARSFVAGRVSLHATTINGSAAGAQRTPNSLPWPLAAPGRPGVPAAKEPDVHFGRAQPPLSTSRRFRPAAAFDQPSSFRRPGGCIGSGHRTGAPMPVISPKPR